ncbi:KRAB-A domain-containing protein 2 [Trichinella papuae]|uniref:KRAB-A domain-containing protein 2 n=1 Tax=Trichinella papuae TaxID=268474 RepID=A0A0V1ML11_9BILA|nr:KRAB-A domain-containing protein 2 [Trichinella papuae]
MSVGLHCLNHFAKFCILGALKSKRVDEVALNVFEIFITLSSSRIFKFRNCKAEKSCWPELKLVTGRLRPHQRQGAFERFNGVVEDKLAMWIVYETTVQRPILVAYGEKRRIGLESYVLSKSLVEAAKPEEVIEEFLACLEEANEEESFNKDGQKYERNGSNILQNF